MLLLQLREQSGIRGIEGPLFRPLSMASSLSLAESLIRIKTYERAYSVKYRLAYVEYSLLGVQVLEEVPLDLLRSVNVCIVDTLPQNPDQVGT